ncbi:MAG: archaellin/type IV pilin N-terminal domain-containing protein [Nanoarchaeota archaeon]
MIDKKKGISPVIAVLLLTALTIVMSLTIVAVFQGFIKEKCELSNQACELLCEKVKLESSYSDGRLYISNLGNVPIHDVEIKISVAGGYETKSILEDFLVNWSEEGLAPGKVFSGYINIGDSSQALLIPVLKGDNEKIHSCGEGFEKNIG